ncbi:hypothetical protein [Fictibacillus sp. NRS-1165]|uniref:hypothetical protein n=1 Tax=Fictibacillus sp. NRS-1165 TaxID=3144463 RepID=UPI003D1A9B90
MSIIIPIAVYLPEIAIRVLPVEYKTKIILPTLFSYLVILILLVIQFKRQTNNTRND